MRSKQRYVVVAKATDTRMDAIPEIFFRAAWMQVEKELQMAPDIKVRLYQEAARLHQRSADRRDVERSLSAILYQVDWRWPRAEPLVCDEDGEVYPSDVAAALFHWLENAAHKFYRRGQIRALLTQKMGHVIQVSVLADDGSDIAPCGSRNDETLQPSKDVLMQMPPCRHPFCACSWMLTYPEEINRWRK